MSLNIHKAEVATPSLSLDVLKLIDKTVADVLGCVSGSFYTNGNLNSELAIKNLHNIRGEMFALKNVLAAIS